MASDDIRLPPKWIELNLTKRECAAFIASPEDEFLCQCGRRKIDHKDFTKHIHHLETWNPSIHTRSFPTDAHGTVIFEGEHHPNKAHYVRLAYDTNPELVLQLMTLVWGLEMPKLVISIQGGNTNFELSPRMGKILQLGLIKAAKSTGAWIFTGGLNDGVTKHIGTALSHERSVGFRKGGRVVLVGIAPWGVVEHREELLYKNKDRIYSPLEHAQSKFRLLNPRHSNFLLVDNGSVGKMGGESYFRRRLEKCIASYPTSPHKGCDIPCVCIVIEGGFYTLRTIGDYLHDDPPTPVVIFAGTGRTADFLAWVMKRIQQLPLDADINSFQEEIYACMAKIYHVNLVQCAVLFAEVKRILLKKNLVTVYNIHANTDEDFDAVILASIFRSQHWSPLQQLSLTLVWDRVDIATNEVFVYGREWSTDHLEHAMMEALVSNRLDFVSLLLEHGLNMQSFLTVRRLETLYNTDHSKLLRMLVSELAKLLSKSQAGKSKHDKHTERKLTMHDIGIGLSHMMGHIYKSNYIHMLSRAYSADNAQEYYQNDDDRELKFLNPFDDLFVWSVLTKRHGMALLLWRHGQGALAKALVAVKLNKFIVQELELTEKTETSLAVEFQNYVSEWEKLSYELVDTCFRQDQKRARQLLTMELDRWSKMTCLTLAVMGNHRMLLGHPCCQMLLADLWMGALNIKSHSTIKIVLGILFPFLIYFWDYKSTEELKLLPHQEKASYSISSQSTQVKKGQWVEKGMSESASLYSYGSKSKESFGDIFHIDKSAINQLQRTKERHVDLDEVAQKLLEEKAHHTKHLDNTLEGHFELGSNDKATEVKARHHVTILEAERPLYPSEKQSVLEMSPFASNEQPYGNASHHHQRSSYVTTKQTLKTWKKFYEFQRAPVTNFYRHTMAYLVFVFMLAYLILVPQERHHPGLCEIYVISYLSTLGMEVIRDFLSIDALNWSQKWVEFRTHIWQIADFCGVTFFMLGVGLRFGDYFEHGMLLYRVSSIYWNLRLYKYMGVHRFVGPKIVMMSRMLKHMAYFAMIILVVIISFGMAREAIRFPDAFPTWRNIAEAFLEPYVMMFGEVDTDALSPQCGEPEQPLCPIGYWIIPLTWAVYMMVANILIVNVLIAVFNGIYSEIDAIALEVWMFQRFTFVMEFEEKPLLPPPAIVLCHIYQVLRWAYEKTKLCLCEQKLEVQLEDDDGPRIIMGNDHRLKTFLNVADANIVFDFEEDNLATISTSKVVNGASSYDDTLIESQGIFGQRFHDPLSGDRQGIQQLKSSFQDLATELELHRNKLDKLLSYWEMEQEVRDTDNLDDNESSNSILRVNSQTRNMRNY